MKHRHLTFVILLSMVIAPAFTAVTLGQDDLSLPSGIEPFEEPLELRFQPITHFTLAWSSNMLVDGKVASYLEGFVMDGSIQPHDVDQLVWIYTLFNVGHDRELREWGKVEAITDSWGEVLDVIIISSELPDVDESRRPGSFALLSEDKNEFWFWPCCLPRNPIWLGDEILDGEVAVGILTKDDRKFLVLEFQGKTNSASIEQSPEASFAGYRLIDTSNGLTADGIWSETSKVQEAEIGFVDRVTAQY